VTRRQRRAVAYHEAGHAVAHAQAGDPIELVTIVPTAHYLGQVRLAQTSSSHDPVTELMCLLAGPAAEAIYGSFDPAGSADDLAQMIQVVAGTFREEETWSAIDWVAQALLTKKKLSGDEVKTLIGLAARWKSSQRTAIAKITGRTRLI
jgi:hypothetical protein